MPALVWLAVDVDSHHVYIAVVSHAVYALVASSGHDGRPPYLIASELFFVDFAGSRGVYRGKWTQLASSLAQGGKNSTLKGGRIPPDIWVTHNFSLRMDHIYN